MRDGLVSIITSIYDSEAFVAKAIESVQAQTYTDWELLITDDCSKDAGPEIVRSYAEKDPRVKLLSLSENGGPGVSRNNSIKHAEGRYVAFLDSDDTWEPEKLEKQLALMRENNCGVVYSSYLKCDVEDHVTGMVRCRAKIPYWRIVCDNAIGFLTMMYDRQITGEMLMPEIRKRQDWGFNIMLLKKCRIAYGILEPLASYRIRKGSVSRDKFPLIKYNIAIYRQVLNYSKVGSVLMFIFVFMPFYLGKKLLNVLKTITFQKSQV